MDLADALGGLTCDGLSNISRVFEYLGIHTTSQLLEASDQPIEPTLKITIDTGVAQDLEATFDHKTRRWRVASATPQASDNVRNGEQMPRRAQLRPTRTGTKSIDRDQERAHGNSIDQPLVVQQDDWTEQLPHTEHVDFILSRDWSATSLGPIRDWPLILQSMTHKMLADPRPACLYWGEDRTAIYNEPFVEIAYSRHPAMMGAAAEVAMPATWPFLSQMFDEVYRSGNAFSAPDFEMEVNKAHGFLEEAWYDGVWIPVKDPRGSIVGLYNSGFEITKPKILDRRTKLLHRIYSTPNFHKTTTWQHILDACESFERDVPLLVLYSAQTDANGQSQRCTLRLEGCLGAPQGHAAVPDTLELNKGNQGFVPALRSSQALGASVAIDTPAGKVPDFLEGLEWRGFQETSNKIIVTPLYVTGLIAGFLIMGTNPRVPFDEDHQHFIEDFGRVSTAVLSSRIGFEQAREREAVLSTQLTERQRFIRKLAEVATVGIYSISTAGNIAYANSKFFDITGISRKAENADDLSFIDSILEEDQPKATNVLVECTAAKKPKSINIRLKRKWTPPGSSTEEHCWILNSITPNIESSKVSGVIGCVADISHTMWALQLQKIAVKTAEEAKRRHEKFIASSSVTRLLESTADYPYRTSRRMK
ncbi:hypothetical protein MBLNU459_g7712t2 [Dothideomycetes sp. NU459]